MTTRRNDLANDWSWHSRPTDDGSFEAMMVSIDHHLHESGLLPHQRPLNAASIVTRKVCNSDFKIGPAWFFEQTQDHEPFSDADLRRRVEQWYTLNYGDQLKFNIYPWHSVVEIGGNIWRVKIPLVYGAVKVFIRRNLEDRGYSGDRITQGSHNILTSLEGLTPAIAARLSNEDLAVIVGRFLLAQEAVAALDWLNGNNLFVEARADYRHSVDAILASEYAKARWETAQTLEKVIKGIVQKVGCADTPRGSSGHHMRQLAVLLSEKAQLSLPSGMAEVVDCKPGVRYGEIPSDRTTALAAHRALLLCLRAIGQQLGLRVGFPKVGGRGL